MSINQALLPTFFTPSHAVQRVAASSLRRPQPASGGELVSLAMGEPGFDTPAHVIGAAGRALQDGFTHYAHPQGDIGLRAAIAEHLGLGTGAEANILITHGGTGGLAAAILAIVNPGDTVVLPDPTYSLYADLVQLAGGRAVPVPLAADLHWDLEALSHSLSGAKLFVFCNPSNPTGIVHRAAELDALAEMLADTATLVIADEAYSDLVFTDAPFTSAINVTGLRSRTIYCQTFSKAHAMTGWRIGYLAGPADAINAITRVHSTIAGPINSATQRAAIAALGPESVATIDAMRTHYRHRMNLMVDVLKTIDTLQLVPPEGAFYAFPRFDLALSDVELVEHLRQGGVLVRPGSEFGAAGAGHIRLSFAAPEADIRVGLHRLRTTLESLRPPTTHGLFRAGQHPGVTMGPLRKEH